MRLLPDLYRAWSRVDAKLVAVLRDLAVGKRPWPLLIHGAPGTGKTCAGLCLADVVETASYYTVEEVCDAVMGRGGTDVADLWRKIETKALVVLDELGTRERVGDLEYSSVKRVLDVRETKHHRCLVAISNVPPDALVELYDRRVYSRLTCGTVYHLAGPDRRFQR